MNNKEIIYTPDGTPLYGVYEVYDEQYGQEGVTGTVYYEYRERSVFQRYDDDDFKWVMVRHDPCTIEELLKEKEKLQEEFEARQEDIDDRLRKIAQPYIDALRQDAKDAEEEARLYKVRGGYQTPEYMRGAISSVAVYQDYQDRGKKAMLAIHMEDGYRSVDAPLALIEAGEEAIKEHFASQKAERVRKLEEHKRKRDEAERVKEKELYEQLKAKFER